MIPQGWKLNGLTAISCGDWTVAKFGIGSDRFRYGLFKREGQEHCNHGWFDSAAEAIEFMQHHEP